MSALASYLVSIGWNPTDASFVGVTQADGLTATGTTQGTAYQITANVNNFTTVAAGVNDGCKLPPIAQVKHAWVLVANSHATDTLKIYPASGEYILGNAVDVHIIATVNVLGRLLFPISSTKWVAI